MTGYDFEMVEPPLGGELEPEELLDLRLRVWAELGRARMPTAAIVGMGPGTIIELDRTPEDLTKIYVNGALFGHGRLILVDGEWAIRLESIEHPDGIEQTSSDGSDG